ncbi:hypothetical protein [Pedobacter aquatilis]|uniref:hypothetical protein n=1 Tax=Pedobacter aquatilis TaxID=351343 RepID=UPI00292D112C|nr:hypothetical protein [Pedobacter aquatilis]
MATKIYRLLYYQKFIGISLIALGIPLVLMTTPANSTVLISGLFVLFTSWEKVMDERLLAFKTTSLYAAIIISYVFRYASKELAKQQLLDYEMTDIDHFILMVFALANLIYYARLWLGKNSSDDE